MADTTKSAPSHVARQGLQERGLRLDDAAAVRALGRRQHELKRVLADNTIEPAKGEALRELRFRSQAGEERPPFPCKSRTPVSRAS